MWFWAPSLFSMLLLVFTYKAEGYYGENHMQCYYTRDLVTIELISSWYFNKAEYLRYNSSTDRYTGYTVYGARMADSLNLSHNNSLNYLVYTFCKDLSDRYSDNVLKKVKPKVVVRSLTAEPDVLPAVLTCHVYDYHPKGINVTWLSDGKVVSKGVSSTDELSDGDWFYQFHTYLEYIPRPGENISCRVEHESLTQPIIYTWGSSMPVAERNKLIIGIFFLVFGIVLGIAGFLFYMLRFKARETDRTPPPMPLVRTVSETTSEATSEASNP